MPVPFRPPRVNLHARPTSAPHVAGSVKAPPGYVRVYCADPPYSLTALLGAEPVKLSGGGGGWELVERPHQTAMTIWSGGEPYSLTLPLMLDDLANHGEGDSIERAVRTINRLARGDDDSEPGIVEIGGVPLPVDEWVIESLDWGDPIRGNTTLRLQRQPVTLNLREYVPPEYLQLRRRALAKPRRKTKVVTVKKGDTPAKIARRVKCKWTVLRELNPGIIKKANQKVGKQGDRFKVGMKLRAPVKRPARGGGRGGHGRPGQGDRGD